MKQKLLIIMLFTLLFAACSQLPKIGPISDVDNAKVTFNDEAFEQIIRNKISRPDGDIYVIELESIYVLNCFDLGIQDISGIEHCKSLIDLNLGSNNIKDISLLKELNNLEKLNIRSNEMQIHQGSSEGIKNHSVVTYLISRGCDVQWEFENIITPPIQTPTPTATDNPNPTATATDDPDPTATIDPTPTATDNPEPTATITPTPTATIDFKDIIPIMTSNTSPEGIASASSKIGSGYEAWKAFDGDDESESGGWTQWISAKGPMPAWLAYEFDSPREIIKYYILPQYSSKTVDRLPIDFSIQGTNDDTTWITLDSQTGISWTIYEGQYFKIANPGSYKKYRLYVDKTNRNPAHLDTGVVSIRQFKLSE